VRVHGFGFNDTNLRSYAEAEALLHEYLKPITFDTAEIHIDNATYIMHFRDIPKVIKALITREDLRDECKYEFEELRNQAGGTQVISAKRSILTQSPERMYSEITNSNNFRRMESRIPIGNTLIYVIFAIDDTCLSSHSGQAKARPLYLTLGNFSNRSRRQLNRHAWMLVGLLPIPNENHSMTPSEKMQFNHKTLEITLRSLVRAERTGMDITCSDGVARLCTLVPAQLIVDLLEAYTLAGIPNKYCPKCLVRKKDMHDLITVFPTRNSEEFKYVLQEALDTCNMPAIRHYCEKYVVAPIHVSCVCHF
jgi:hypothetical protein